MAWWFWMASERDACYLASGKPVVVQDTGFGAALPTGAGLLGFRTLGDCTGDVWQTDLWPDEARTAPAPHGGLHGSSPWFLGWQALPFLDYDLTGGF